jgi:hypothetical protein
MLYNLNIIQTLIYKRKKIEKILSFHGESIDEEKYSNFLS